MKTEEPSKRVPEIRITRLNEAPVRTDGRFVLYWMTAFRRTRCNFSLQRAAEWAEDLKKPLVILEALRCDYPWASDRIHAFVLQGMRENHGKAAASRVTHYPYVEDAKSAGKGLLESLARLACAVVTDDYPAFFLPRMIRAAASRIETRMEAVDANGILPLKVPEQVFGTAYAFRRFLQKHLPDHLGDFPSADPLADLHIPSPAPLPQEILTRWPPASDELLGGDPSQLSRLPIDHRVSAVGVPGGGDAAAERLEFFLRNLLSLYHESRNHPDEGVFSGLSPYLHFGHISSHEIVRAVMEDEEWSPALLAQKASGQRSGWWGMSEGAEAFLDQVITWRELGFNMCSQVKGYDRFDSLPEWALKELRNHAGDPRPYLYSLDQFESASTHDELWNCAQRQLLQEGTIHNYLRMLWGKKILEWSRSPEEALEIMIELNNKYALDGRDPNSYTGIFWILGRYDRPWVPERPVFGRIRYMSSASTLRKLRLQEYLARCSGGFRK
jgi:deoxyribodipyrimidine photo-lyase